MPLEPNFDPQAWMLRARSAFALAKVVIPGAVFEDSCYQAHQAAEKAIKALYLAMGLGFRYTHDLGDLLLGLQTKGVLIPPEVRECIRLTRYAVEARYPYVGPMVDDEEHAKAVAYTATVLEWVEKEIERLSL